MFNKKFFLTLWLTISFFTSAQVVFGQITLSQPVTIAQKTVPKRAVAIITFENLSASPENDWVGQSFAESLTTKLSKLESLDLYERRQLHAVLSANGLDQQEVSEVHWEKAERIGGALHLKGVQSVLIGSVAMMGSDENPETPLQVNARTVQVETGEVTKGEAFSVGGNFSQLFDLQTLLAQEFVSALGVKPTSEEEQRMQERETESLAAYRLYILGLQYLDEGKYSEAKAAFWEAAKPANFPAALLEWEKAAEQEIFQRERAIGRDEAMRSALTASARALASQGATNIYVLGMVNEFNGEYDAAIEAYRDFLKYTQNTVLRWKYQTKSALVTPDVSFIGISRPQYPPLVVNGRVYIADEGALYALESDSGRLLWNVGMKHPSQPTVADGTLYISDREGGTLYALDAKTGEVVWQSALGVRLGRNAIVDGNIVYLWSNKPSEKSDIQNTIFALNRADGSRLWEHNVGARYGYSSPFTVSDGTVYVFSTAQPTWDAVYKLWDWANSCTLSALDGATGKPLWKSQLPIAYRYYSCDRLAPQVDYAPVVSEGRVYVVEADRRDANGSLYALSAADGKVLWRSDVKCSGFLPLVSEGAGYVPSLNGIYVFDAKEGSLRTELNLGREVNWGVGTEATIWEVDYSLRVADERLYTRPSKGESGYGDVRDREDTLYAFSLETGAMLWQYRVQRGIRPEFTVVEATVYFTAEDRNLYALHAKTGQLLWKYELSDRMTFYSAPTVVEDTVYVSQGRTVYALNASGASSLTGPSDLDARVAIGRALWLKGDLITARTTLQSVIDTKSDIPRAWRLLAEIAEQLKETQEAVTIWQKVRRYASSLDEDYQEALQHLKSLAGLQWEFKPSPAFSIDTGWAWGEAVTKNSLYVHDFNREFLYKLDRATGAVLERYRRGWAFPDLTPQKVYLHDGRVLSALDAQTEDVLWNYDIINLWDAYVLDQTLFIDVFISHPQKSGRKLYALSAKTGNLLWQSEWRGHPVAGFNGTLYTIDEFSNKEGRYEQLNAISSDTGELLWTYKIRQHYPDKESSAHLELSNLAGGTPLIASDDGVYVAAEVVEVGEDGTHRTSGGVLLALDRTTGTLRWKYETSGLSLVQSGNVDKSNLVYVSPFSGGTHALDAKTGELLWKQPVWMNLIAGNTIYGTSGNGLIALNAHSGQLLWQSGLEGGRVFQIQERLVLSEGVLYTLANERDPAYPYFLYALDAVTGMSLWMYDAGDRIASFTVANEMLYLHTADGRVDAIDIRIAATTLQPHPKLMAVNYLERKQYAEAIEALKPALSQNGSDPNEQIRLRQMLAEAYLGMGNLEAAEKEYVQTGFPKESDWWVIGPFDNTDDTGRTVAYPPETEVNLSATYEGKAGPVKWQTADDGRMDGQLDFTQLFTPSEWGVAYAIIDVVSPDDREAQLRIGSDDGVKVWLNGDVIWTNQVPRGLRLDEDVVPMALKQGTNRLLFKVDQGVGGWGLAVRITAVSGQPMEGLRYVATVQYPQR